MVRQSHSFGALFIFSLALAFWTLGQDAVHCSKTSCSICGQRCLDACGTEAFRPCCLSYNRKRASLENESESSEEAASKSDSRPKTIDLLRQLYGSLDGVIGIKLHSRLFHVRKKAATDGQQWKDGDGTSDVANSAL